MTTRAARFAASYALLRMAADLGDHWIQSDHQAVTKGQHDENEGQSSRAGRIACTAHVASYTATQGVVLLAGARALGLHLKPSRVVTALALSAGTHWWADRRVHLKAVAEATGKGNFYNLGGPLGGNYALDQAFHHAMETIAAAIAASK
ncbi:transcriptional regulator [Streptomyces longhuiensis]|uniref:transcriptional regulator n=1 Tax=Streptomyces longhuiensis TaxID=2880933 RepID=UPI001D0BB9E8|nr:transcriptional regulator [Streptomyces longhuiensis]UDM05573.1 transcriptional regulator [Streptomyces longhuiensis]